MNPSPRKNKKNYDEPLSFRGDESHETDRQTFSSCGVLLSSSLSELSIIIRALITISITDHHTGCIISVIGVAPHNAQQLWRWQARNQALRSVSLKFRIDPQNDRKQHSQCSVSAVSDRHCSAQNNVQFFQTLHSFRDDRILGQHDFTNFRPLVSGFEPHDGSCMCSMRMF
jgi:hypothetical protein